jgi:hypothetical protein
MLPLFAALVQAVAPDPDRAGAAASEPHRSIRLIYLVRSLLEYGKELLVTARLRYGTPGFAQFARPFGIADARLLVTRIGQAMRRAAILSDMLARQAGLGRHGRGAPARSAPSRRQPRERQPAPDAPPPDRRARRTAPAADSSAGNLPHGNLPSAAQIAAELRRRPIAEVIAGICHDLGITPDHPLWQEFREALAAFGVTLTVPQAQHDAQPPDVPAAEHSRTARPTIRAMYAAARDAAAQAAPPPREPEHPSTGPPELLGHIVAA